MTLFDRPISSATYAAIRFGYGLPAGAAPETPEAMLARLSGPDRIAAALPQPAFEETRAAAAAFIVAFKEMRAGTEGAEARRDMWRSWLNAASRDNLVTAMARAASTDDPFRERLFWFWSDHFSARATKNFLGPTVAAYGEEAIRPHLNGRFADLVKAATTHPVMIEYLDQSSSIGPNSVIGQRRGRGLNENLAREIMELHTLGVDAAYSQADVTQFAELLTGLWSSLDKGFAFRTNFAEPGAETVLGQSYGGAEQATLADIHAALDDLALHPSTTDHIARKLAVHFVSDAPDPDLVATMAAAFRRSDGWLPDVYAAMLDHPAAWRDFGAKVKQPFDWIASSLRALRVPPETLLALDKGSVRRLLSLPLRLMGQPYLEPPGPDGWPEQATAWIAPQGLAARIAWAMQITRRVPDPPADPQGFARSALAEAASPELLFAAGAAETRTEAVAIVLSSVEFNRR